MKLQLDPAVETFFLLADADWGKRQKKRAIEQLDALGIDGAACYAAQFHLIERYFSAFAACMVKDAGSSYIADLSDQAALLFVSLLVSHPAWLRDFEALPEEEVINEVRSGISAIMGTGADFIAALETSGLSDRARWQLSVLWQQPKPRIALVIRAIAANIPAFNQARRKIEPEMASVLSQLGDQLRDDKLSPMVDQAVSLYPHARITPSLAAPLLVMAIGDTCVLGLLLNRVFTGRTDGLADIEAVRVSKALSDANRVAILHILKGNRLYGVELARKIGLTPATTSYHMNMLVSAGLVEVARQDARMFYRLSANGIERYRAWLETLLSRR
ncbi:regulatory protein ArsR [Coriobacterium glomerans PW2]|uniref:Regulatory protein ArsR n=1 Tax=Coriobacterium glomerans (strain ATCC 49209 / DSM 20642 / JCM 10262 / PW2) TaxID=700015 RepID=F2N8Y3_CORGP|nr:winged helix-turn-helix domain-containing protein [Coriobacterium glomerans]AEB07583.1 regulatory protein ArsR [Coriobacterium glomerans PW2]